MKFTPHKLFYNILWLGLIILFYKHSEELREVGMDKLAWVVYGIIGILVAIRMKVRVR